MLENKIKKKKQNKFWSKNILRYKFDRKIKKTLN